MMNFCRSIQIFRSSEPSPKFRTRAGLAHLLLCACLAVALAGCTKTEIKPVDISDKDTCFKCRSLISDNHYAAELKTKDGFTRKFDDMGCLIDYAKNKIGKKNIAAFFVMDYPTQKWIWSEEAFFVKSDKFQTPQNGGILAFKDKAQAEGLAAQFQAKVVPFDDLLK
jgi:copper chaperone NosL